MIPKKIEKWIEKETFPQRLLLSGNKKGYEIAAQIAAKLQKTSIETIQKGIHPDTIVFRDNGKSFKIDWSEAAKKDDQNEYENVRGLIRWSHQKPAKGNYRIVILENIERLSYEAPHACLKLIEEPPQKTIFLFSTQNHHSHKILQTILSRLTVVRIPDKKEEFFASEEIRMFFEDTDIIKKFQYIDFLDKESKNNKEKKIDRTVFLNALHEMLEYARKEGKEASDLDTILESYNAIYQNTNPRLTLERLALVLTP